MQGDIISFRYSSSFKQKVISEIETGKYSLREASKIYNVSDVSLYKWLRRFGKNHLIGKIVRIEMIGEADRIKQLEAEKRALESALAQAQLKIITLESTMEVAEEIYKIDFKKNVGLKGSKKAGKK
jgi:transposase